jgi:TonB family protein
MSLTLLSALLFATSVASEVENPRFLSANGGMCVVLRMFPRAGDFEGITWDEYERRAADTETEPEPTRAALYQFWAGDYRKRLAEFTFGAGEQYDGVLVTNDGHVITYGPLRCDASAGLLTIRASDGAISRTLGVRDVLTANDQQWLCRGDESEVRYALDGETLRMTMLVTGGAWDDPKARHRTVDIDVATGTVAAPDRDYCPAPVLVTPEAGDSLPRTRKDPDVVPITSYALLDRAVVREIPEYPEVAVKARISGRVGVQVVVGRDGNVEEATIVKPVPFGLDQAVRSAMMKWHFARGISRVTGVIVFRFEIVRSFKLLTLSCPASRSVSNR